MFCYVYRGKSTRKRCLGNASTRPHMKKFSGLVQNKDPWSISKWRDKLATSHARSCLEETTKNYTQRTTSDGADILGSHMMIHGVNFFHNQDVWSHILHKATLTTFGTKEGIEKSLREPPPIIKDCSLSTLEVHSRWKSRRLRYTLNSQDTFG
jgi:hypothetical protein